MDRLTRLENGIYNPNKEFLFISEVMKKLGKLEDLMEKYEIEDLTDLEIALDYYDHRFDDVQTRRIDENEI